MQFQKHCLRYPNQQDVFVALDAASGGYPYAVTVEQAYNFRSKEAALAYCMSDEFVYTPVTVTYEY